MPDVKKVNSGLLEFSDDQQVLVAIDEDGEVQKAVIIDEDGSETPIGTTPTGKITITENGTNIDVAQYATADVAVEGGSSDFSTAEVNIKNQSGAAVYCAFSVASDSEDKAVGVDTILRDADITYNVILYKGYAYLMIDSENIAVTGNISTTNGIVVSGDGTITITTGN